MSIINPDYPRLWCVFHISQILVCKNPDVNAVLLRSILVAKFGKPVGEDDRLLFGAMFSKDETLFVKIFV